MSVLVLALPALGLGALAWFGHGWAAWGALALGPTLGAVVMVLGVRLGARLFEKRGPELLQDLVRVR
jgi:ABC-2 type transport system permease protein